VMTGSGQFVELQGTGEEETFSQDELQVLLGLAEKGIDELVAYQQEVLGELTNAFAGGQKG
ncbi:MAG TPA: ribonuclease PH, partial [Bacillales bacterium]|nr:ribonuclease PH [Bacillales bacterium]